LAHWPRPSNGSRQLLLAAAAGQAALPSFRVSRPHEATTCMQCKSSAVFCGAQVALWLAAGASFTRGRERGERGIMEGGLEILMSILLEVAGSILCFDSTRMCVTSLADSLALLSRSLALNPKPESRSDHFASCYYICVLLLPYYTTATATTTTTTFHPTIYVSSYSYVSSSYYMWPQTAICVLGQAVLRCPQRSALYMCPHNYCVYSKDT
jgi:hypothetical protein